MICGLLSAPVYSPYLLASLAHQSYLSVITILWNLEWCVVLYVATSGPVDLRRIRVALMVYRAALGQVSLRVKQDYIHKDSVILHDNLKRESHQPYGSPM